MVSKVPGLDYMLEFVSTLAVQGVSMNSRVRFLKKIFTDPLTL